jgi:hypothetical protein
MKTLAIWVIAACMVAETFSVYYPDSGGVNIFFGSFGYHIAEQ